MKMPMIVVVHPEKYDKAKEERIGACESDEENRARWLEVRALEQMLEELGCTRWSSDRDRTVNFEVSGCNWESGMSGSVWDVPQAAMKALAAKYRELRTARETAIAKLTDEELYALGITRHQKERVDPGAYVQYLSDRRLAPASGEVLDMAREVIAAAVAKLPGDEDLAKLRAKWSDVQWKVDNSKKGKVKKAKK